MYKQNDTKDPLVYPINKAISIARRFNEDPDDDWIYVIDPIKNSETAKIKIFNEEMTYQGYLTTRA